MKQNDIPNISVKLTPQNYENIFNVYVGEDDEYYYNLLRTVNFPVDINPTTYSEYLTTHNDTWPLIAWKFYKNIKLWWVICAVNQIQNPVLPPPTGVKLKILSVNIVRNLLNNLKQ